MSVECMFLYHVCTWCPWKSEEGIRSSKTGFTELPYGCYKLNPGPMGEQLMLLVTESFLQWQRIYYSRQPIGHSLKETIFHVTTQILTNTR